MVPPFWLLVAGWLCGWLLLWRVPLLRAAAGTRGPAVGADTAGEVTVVIPARDEEANLPGLLASLRAQVPPTGRILVVDDASTDATADVARAGGAEVVTGAPLPDGWTGKTWACHQGVAAATTDRIVLIDADVTLAPQGMAALLDAHDACGGLLSVQPYHRVPTVAERASALFNVVSVMGVGMASPWRRGRASGAFGPVLCLWRADLAAVGGYASVRAAVAEDLALAQRFRLAGLPVTALGGGGLASFRMYPGGWRQLVEGWSKNMATGATGTAPLRALGVALWVAASIVATQLAVTDGLLGTAVTERLAALGAYLAVAGQVGVMLRALGSFGWTTALAFPLALAAFLAVFARSAWLTAVTREVRWRGRAIAVGRGAGAGPRAGVGSGTT